MGGVEQKTLCEVTRGSKYNWEG